MSWIGGQRVLVTGGGSGLGRAIVRRFVAEGAQVAVLDRDPAKLADLRADFGDAVAIVDGDVTSWADNVRAVATAVDTFGSLDTLIGNAGIWDYGTSLPDLAGDGIGAAFDELMGVNLKGPLLGAKAALPALLESRGSIIFTVSNAGFDPGGGGPLYTASKFAVRGLITQLAYELAPKVRVNGVAPGGISSDLRGPRSLGLDAMAISDVPGLEDIIKGVSPLGFLPDAEAYTGAYVLLASTTEASTITGTVLRADCGIGIRGLDRPAAGTDL